MDGSTLTSRRSFLKASAAMGGGLLLSVSLPLPAGSSRRSPTRPNTAGRSLEAAWRRRCITTRCAASAPPASVPGTRNAGAAELHRVVQERQGRDLGADAESRTGAHAGGSGAGREGKRRHHPPGPGWRRLRTAPAERLHGRSGGDLETSRCADQAGLEPRRRHPARLLPPRRLSLLPGGCGCPRPHHRLPRPLRQLWGG
ncbi:twin-arginine translocation signal domain-containing protein [Archangium violaceum]|nr:twin-arginine translocation signal domain-containing protein [Archangium violaceum]